MLLNDALYLMSELLDITIFYSESFNDFHKNMLKVIKNNTLDDFNSFGNFERIESYMDSISTNYAIQINSTLQLKVLLIKLENNKFIIIGPYIDDLLTKLDCSIILRKVGINTRKTESLMLLRNKFAVLNVDKLIQKLQSVLSFSMDKSITINLKKINLIPTNQSSIFLNENNKFYNESIIQRYTHEQKFMCSIQNGDFKTAIDQWHLLHDSVKPLKQTGNVLTMAQISAAVNRTTIRIAASNAGIPPVLNDQISKESAKKIRVSSSLKQIYEEHEHLIRIYCDVIQRQRKNNYSVLTISILYFLDKHFTDSFQINHLAAELNISTNYLIQSFKEDVHATPKNYVLNKRLNLSKRLLSETADPINVIGESCGFTDANYFTRVFKKSVNMTPSKYRQKYKFSR
ncbi:HTH-type transcriptional activator RhaR [Companilactobacillus paralimentarius]